MTPNSWVAAILFVGLVAPGLLFDLLSERRRALPTESAFREASRVVLSSFIFTGIPMVLLGAVRGIFAPTWLPDPGQYWRGGSNYLRDHYQLPLYTLLVVLVAAFALACTAHIAFMRRDNAAKIVRHSAWTQVFSNDRPKGGELKPFARVRLDDGSAFEGFVRASSPDIETSDRELVLEGPCLRSRTGDKKFTEIPGEWERVVLKNSDTKSITVSYRNKDQLRAAMRQQPIPDLPSSGASRDRRRVQRASTLTVRNAWGGPPWPWPWHAATPRARRAREVRPGRARSPGAAVPSKTPGAS